MSTTSRDGPGIGGGAAPDRWMTRMDRWRPVAWLVLVVVAAAPPRPSYPVAGLMALAGVAVLLAHRIRPVGWRVATLVLTALGGVAASLVDVGHHGLGPVPIFVAAVATSRLVPSARTVMVLGVAYSVAAVWSLYWVSGTWWASIGALGVPLLMTRQWDRVALRREHERVVALLAELEQRRDADVRAAAADERARIARDLHDVLAHTLSGLSLHLQAIRAVLAGRPDTPETVITSVDRAADLARTGLDEARHAVAALREDTAPGAGQLRALVERHGGAELVLGDGAGFDALAPPVREAAVAAVRESLTNADRYAPGARVRVRVDTDDGLRVRVDDDGARAPVTAADHGGGAGLRGLAERAATVGGTLDARADPPGWCVELRVPATAPTGAGR